MNAAYQAVLEYMTAAGRRLVRKASTITEISTGKPGVTEEDLRIERGFKEIIDALGGDHVLFAEEENSQPYSGGNVWVVDPISGTRTYLKGLPHYGIAVAHMVNTETRFSAVYDPAMNEMFTAYRNGGAFLNGRPIHVSEGHAGEPYVVFCLARPFSDRPLRTRVFRSLERFSFFRNMNSFAINYCHVACGRYDGFVTLAKDAYPEFAGSLIVREAGGHFTNCEGSPFLSPSDRIFVGGSSSLYERLAPCVRAAVIKRARSQAEKTSPSR